MIAGMNIIASIALAVEGLFYLFVIVRVLQRRSRQEGVTTLVSLYAFISFALLIVDILWRLGKLAIDASALSRVHAYVALALAFMLVLVVRSFLRLRSESYLVVGIFWLVLLSVFSNGVLPLPKVIWTNGRYMLPSSGLSLGIMIIGWAVFLSGAILSTLVVHHRTRQPLHRNRVSYWLPIFLLLAINDGLVFSLGNPWGEVPRLLAVLLLAYVLTRVHLPDFRQIFRQVLTYLVGGGLVLLGYFAGYNVLNWLKVHVPNLDPLLAGLGVTLLLVIIGLLLYSLLRRLIRRLLPTEGYNPSVTLRDYSLSISNIIEMERLATVAIGLIIESMDIRRGFLFLVDKEAGQAGNLTYRLRGVRRAGEKPVRSGTLDASGPIVRYLTQVRHPLLQFDIDMAPVYRQASASEHEWLAELDTEVYAPIFSKNEWIGLLALGAKSSGNRYTDDDMNVVSTLANQTAVALENARLVENLMRLNREIRQAYQALDTANRNLERLDQTKSDFISIASHELRTPLTVLRGYTEMLLDDPVIQKNTYHLQTIQGIHKGTLRLHEIMDSMFDIAQIDTRTADLTMQAVDVPELVRAVCNGLTKSFQERNQTLNVDLPSLPAIKADEKTLRKVFYHLVTNAIKFTPNGGKVAITGRHLVHNFRDLPEGGVEVIVSDTGVGVDPNYRDLIFAKFYQAEEDLNKHSSGKTKFKGGGAGLGLALSKGIVEAHGGRIWVESPGYDEVNFPGSQFHVILPLRKQSDSATVRIGSAVKMKL
jgi:signal transduction histidine kinase